MAAIIFVTQYQVIIIISTNYLHIMEIADQSISTIVEIDIKLGYEIYFIYLQNVNHDL